ncbi:N [Cordylochernes scorpioides]|uniref:N n=1 Tax=Cordylochernes scorpioides TaxID=51811 RepID=A0ABY6L8L0_9ARAC|nr:N [Cordylochernes scorpioides] [Cordylochernes scorpioides]
MYCAGPNCEHNINDCEPNPCKNGGTCHDLVNQYVCSCPHGTQGVLCEINNDDCAKGICHHGGICIDKIGGYECQCPPGFVGPRCEGDVNECLSNPCNGFGTQTCVQLVNDYRCECKTGYMGRLCETKHNPCTTNPCLNGGVCSSTAKGNICHCPPGFFGETCSYSNNSCSSAPCQNGGHCVTTPTGYYCRCPLGLSGRNCELSNDCRTQPCLNGGTCYNGKDGNYRCACMANWHGPHCDKFKESNKGNDIYKPEEDVMACHQNMCPSKAQNNICNEECNTKACNYDGGDCTKGVNPWLNCTSLVSCWEVFRNGVCDEECNNQQCLYDGFDCEPKLGPCNENYENYCLRNYGNGLCDHGCNTEECNWDGLDCEPDLPKLAHGTLMMIILTPPEVFRNSTATFLRDLGYILRTIVHIKKDENGQEMIYPWEAREIGSSSQKSFPKYGTKVYLEIDNRRCVKTAHNECFQSSSDAAHFLAATHSRVGLQLPFQVGDIVSDDQYHSNSGASTPVVHIVVGSVGFIIVALVLGVLLNNRKRAHGITWFPKDFFRTVQPQSQRSSHRRGPDGQEMRNIVKQLGLSPPVDGKDLPWGDYPAAKRMRTDADCTDPRPWTQQHLNAAVGNPDALALTPPMGSTAEAININARGPGGLTPLMLASIRSNEPFDDGDGSAILDMIMQGANVRMTMDRTGESPLHLAARFARADAAQKLLENGSDVNAQDNTGRTPLHAAIAADAQGVFQILLRNRTTNLDAKMHDGTTPLILVARLATEGMLEQLLAGDVDINATDDNGKTALHWAAAVNNIDAVLTLLNHRANKDCQDNKDSTPLFMAAKEGSFEAAKILLQFGANKELGDYMDKQPIDVARERLHNDIVKLLEEFSLPSGQAVQQTSQYAVLQPPNLTSGRSIKSKKKPKPLPPVPEEITSPTLSPPANAEPPTYLKSKGSMRKKKEEQILNPCSLDNTQPMKALQNPEGLKPPIDNHLYSSISDLTTPNLVPNKTPPAYEECIKMAASQQQQPAVFNNQGYTQFLRQMSYQPATKQRPILPTSPTHMAAMRAAHHQKNSSHLPSMECTPDFTATTNVFHHFPTPPSQHSLEATPPQHYLTTNLPGRLLMACSLVQLHDKEMPMMICK